MDKIIIIGSGLTGPLLSILLAHKGYKIDLYEKRIDPREKKLSAGRSINLALSHRGIQALQRAKIFNRIEPLLIPMKGRMIHNENGGLDFQPYSINSNEYINSVSRLELNKILMTAAENTGNVNIHFNQTLVDVSGSELTFCTGKKISNNGIIIGADGSSSQIRKYIDKNSNSPSITKPLGHAYKELNITPDKNGNFQLDSNSLHIWPRGQFMLIALPNTDKSFTCTLFMPNKGTISFESLKSSPDVINFFQSYFSDVLPLLDNFPTSFFDNPTGKLGTVYSNKWNYKKSLIIGDAAHAVVPFFGQGMNASFEDCEVLMNCLDAKKDDFDITFSEFYNVRKPDTDAIARMAIENYIEMRDSVAKDEFINKKKISNYLFKQFPDKFVPRYNMVSFTSIPYNEVYNRGEIQQEIINSLGSDNFDLDDAEKLINSKLTPIS